MLTKNAQKAYEIFCCEKCDYKCSRNSDYVRHLATRKHNSLTSLTENARKAQTHICSHCEKIYKSREGLWHHAKKCPKNVQTNNIFLANLVLEVMKNNTELQKQNQDFQKQLLDKYSTSSTIINNNHSKTFNLQVFLNEDCKDAMNLMDFVDSFKLQFADLEQVGEMGYIEGMTNIIMKKLNEMDVSKRPIHCSDVKRETLYVKDDNVWEKENSTCDKLRKAIKYISKKNSDLIPAWNAKNPLANNDASQVNDQYLQIIQQSMGGSGEIEDNENKIIKKLAKGVLIDKYIIKN
jgi:hypothetical protein